MESEPLIKQIKDQSEHKRNVKIYNEVPRKVRKPVNGWIYACHHLDLLCIGYSFFQRENDEDAKEKTHGNGQNDHVYQRGRIRYSIRVIDLQAILEIDNKNIS